jgi:hypothetical protein
VRSPGGASRLLPAALEGLEQEAAAMLPYAVACAASRLQLQPSTLAYHRGCNTSCSQHLRPGRMPDADADTHGPQRAGQATAPPDAELGTASLAENSEASLSKSRMFKLQQAEGAAEAAV